MSATALTAVQAVSAADNVEASNIIDRVEFKSSTGIFDIDALEALGRVSSATVSPTGDVVLFSISYESVEQNRSNADLYTIGLDGKNLTRLTRTPKSENSAVWIAGGSKIAFMYPDADGNAQVWVMNPDGSDRVQISEIENGVGGFLFRLTKKRLF